MRCDQFMGLNPWARKLVEGESVLAYTEEIVRVYPDGRREPQEPRPVYVCTVKTEESGEYFTGMFEEDYPLHKYTFPDGSVYYEMVQADPWSSGPCFFLALTAYPPNERERIILALHAKGESTKWSVCVPNSLWSQEDIDKA